MSQTAEALFQQDLGSDDIKITEAAGVKIHELMSDADDEIEAVRIYVSGGGCGGMTYGMTFTDSRTEYDTVLDTGQFRVYVDSVALGYLRGVEIDYADRPTGSSFVFNNVFQATGGSGTCGACGAAGGGCG